MSETNTLFSETFWKIANYLDSLKKRVPFQEVLDHLKIDQDDFFRATTILEEFGLKAEFETDGAIKYLACQQEQQVVLSMAEWVAVQLEIESSDIESPLSQELPPSECKELIRKLRSKYHELDISNVLSSSGQLLEYPTPELGTDGEVLKKLDYAVENRIVLTLEDSSGKTEVFPYRVIYLDGGLCLVGELIAQKRLSFHYVKDLIDASFYDETDYTPHYGQIEIDDFIMASRAVNDNEIRLVLKIFAGEKVDLNPKYHFFGKSFVTTNSDGDMIWAAYVEPSDFLYEWLWMHKEQVDVMDPGAFREDFYRYCEERCEKELAKLRKVS